MLKSLIRAIVPLSIRSRISNWKFQKPKLSYAQEGEDLVLQRFFQFKERGFYVDIGAHHPTRLSNTYYFYKRGWTGINIDAMPGSMKVFARVRPKDINLELPISDIPQMLTYYSFEIPAFNGFSSDLSEERIKNGLKLKAKQNMQTHRLSEILEKHMPTGQQIDFMSVDVEGLDLQVLKSNDWTEFRPKMVIVELFGADIVEALHSEINGYLLEQGYRAVAKTMNSTFYWDSQITNIWS